MSAKHNIKANQAHIIHYQDAKYSHDQLKGGAVKGGAMGTAGAASTRKKKGTFVAVFTCCYRPHVQGKLLESIWLASVSVQQS